MARTKQDLIDWIDKASYSSLLSKWRFGISGDPLFEGEVGKHFSKVMAEKRSALDPKTVVGISKALGF